MLEIKSNHTLLCQKQHWCIGLVLCQSLNLDQSWPQQFMFSFLQTKSRGWTCGDSSTRPHGSNAARVCVRVVVRMIVVGWGCPSLYNFYQATRELEPLKKLPARRRWRKALARFTMTPYQDPGRVCEEDWEGGGDGAQRQHT